jgi:predicted metalloprotease with PDZ domain
MTIGGKTVDIVVRDKLAISDSALMGAVASVIRAERGFWGDAGPEHYLVTIGPAPQGTLAGTRLTNSFIADIDASRTLDPDVIELFAHELMHDWIGGVLYANGAEGEGQLSWFVEGFTDYLSKRVLRTSGLISDSTYVAWINRSLREHALSSARDSTWAGIVRNYWRNYPAKREPYLRGELIALRLDAARLDDALRSLRKQAGRNGSALTRDSIISAIAGASSGQAVSSTIDAALTGAVAPLPPVLGGVCVNVHGDRLALWDPGFDLDGSLTAKEVHGVRADGPAARAGLANGLKILGVSVWRGDVTKEMMVAVAADTAKRRITYLPVGRDSVDVQVVERRANCPER